MPTETIHNFHFYNLSTFDIISNVLFITKIKEFLT